MNQHTLHQPVTLSGKGLHTGADITATLLPASEGTGICFRRVDLPDRPCYEALADYVGGTTRGTVLEKGAWRVSTVEHLMAALYALGVTNCIVEVNGAEVPILDGSARPWLEAIRQAGIDEQTAPAREWIVTRSLVFYNGKGSSLYVEPAEQYSVEVFVNYHSPVLGKQSAVLNDLKDFAQDIAAARTFCFLREVRPLLELGLIRGGDLQNALVIYDKRIWQWSMNRLARKLNQPPIDASQLGYLSPLHYENEPARHKLLDLIGDMALSGVRIRGRLIATCPGHAFNTDCCKQLRQYIQNL